MTHTPLGFAVEPLGHDLLEAVRHKIDSKTKPLGALGRLEVLAQQISLIQRSLSPRLRAPHLLLFAGDHGAVAEGISAYPQDVTWQMVANFLNGGAAINVFCRQNQVAVTVVDAGVNHDFAADPRLRVEKIGYGTANFVQRAAMTEAQCLTALKRGAALAQEVAAGGANVLACGEMGIGNTAAASMLLHRVGGLPLEQCVGRGAGLDDAGLAHKRAVLERASSRCPGELPALQALAEFGGFEIAMMVGAFLAAAQARMLILVDGFIVSSALLVAAALEPAVLEYCVFTHCSAEAGHQLLLKHFQAEPLLTLNLRLGEGTGAALAYPLVEAAVNFLNEMASFAEAGVAEKLES
jgi:nicotinate-nucleotide--dimethylbenzimidazole phosphoribosyltransferase